MRKPLVVGRNKNSPLLCSLKLGHPFCEAASKNGVALRDIARTTEMETESPESASDMFEVKGRWKHI